MDNYKLEELNDRLNTTEQYLSEYEHMRKDPVYKCLSQLLESLRIIKSELAKEKYRG